MAWIDFQFVQFDRRDIYVPAMHQIEEMIGMKNLTSGDGFSGVWARIFANWITDEVSGILFWNQKHGKLTNSWIMEVQTF